MWGFVIIAVVLLAGLFYFLRRKNLTRVDAHAPEHKAKKPPGNLPKIVCLQVTVPENGNTCAAVLKFKDKIFPLSEAPKLPLPECGNPLLCQCSFQQITERRNNQRRSGSERRNDLRYEPDKNDRRLKDRRKAFGWKDL